MATPEPAAPATNGVASHDGPVEPPSSFDPALFRSYLLALLPPVIGATPDELDSLYDSEFDERVSRFAGEGSEAIYVVKIKDEAEGACDWMLRRFISFHARLHARGRPTDIFVQAHVSSHVRAIPRRDPRSHQTRTHT